MLLLALAGALASNAAGDAALTRLGKGITAYQEGKYAVAVEHLRGAAARLPKLADYAAYYLTAARVELNDTTVAPGDLALVGAAPVSSPLAARARLLEGRVLLAAGQPGESIRVLQSAYTTLPQPDAAIALAAAYEAARDFTRAADYYQQVYCRYPTTEAATRAAAALVALRDTMGAVFPEPPSKLLLERGEELLEAREYSRARAEFLALIPRLTGTDRDMARVGAGAADGFNGNWSAAYRYLRSLDLEESEADARRHSYMAECARRLGDDGGMMEAVKHLNRHHEHSPWRLKALVTAGNRYLVDNQPDKYVPMYKAAYESFPTGDMAAYCHWKVTWYAYIHRKREAGDRLRQQMVQYPEHPTASASLYFLGRLAERNEQYPAARAYYARLIELFPNYYYGTLARERMAQPKVVRAAASPEVTEDLTEVAFRARRPGLSAGPTAATSARIARARLLRSAGLDYLAGAELRHGARTDGQPQLLAVELAHGGESSFERLRLMKSVGIDYLAMPVDESDRRFWEYLFPLPYRRDLERSANSRGLDPYTVAGLIRQESEFNPMAVSSANAYGLTQVRPSTGKMLARRAGVRRFNSRMLFQPAVNLKLGTYYMRSLLDNWGGKWEETLASYNAGPGRAKDWVTWHSYEEPAEFVESIPFTETREYVQAVLRNAALYRQIYQDRSSITASDEPPVRITKAKAKGKNRKARPAAKAGKAKILKAKAKKRK